MTSSTALKLLQVARRHPDDANTCKEGFNLIEKLFDDIDRLDSALERCKTVLGNMALENEEHPTMGYLFKARWPISHEPLRADARALLPVIEDALNRHAHTQRPP